MTKQHARSARTPADQRTIAGRYAVLEEIGRGGMGIVWLAEDRTIGRRVAIKELHVPAGVPPRERAVFEARVLREARAAGRLNDPGVVTVYDVLQEDSATYIVMELIAAPTLAALVAREGPLSQDTVTRLAEQLLAALEAAHVAGVVHRDVKPSNIMVLPNNRVKLTDFGIAQSTDDTRLTASGTLVGSPAYIAPERLRGDETDARSDLWALAAVLFYAVEGYSPFERPTTAATMHAILNETPELTRCRDPLASVVTGLLNTSPDARPSVTKVSAQLAQPTQAPPTSTKTRGQSRRSVTTKIAWRVALAVVLVAATVAGAALLWVAGRAQPPSGDAPPSANGGQVMPPVVEGQEMVEAGQPSFVTVQLGVPATYRTAVGAELEIVVQGVRAETHVPALGDAPAGYRWLTVLMTGKNTSGPDWDGDLSRSVALIDDRGLWIRPLGDGVVECEPGASKPPTVVPQGQEFDACVAMPVPERTPVTAVVFGSVSTDPDAQRPIRMLVAVPPVTRAKPATSFVVGKAGDPPVEVTLADTTMRAGFDVVLAPSGYLGDDRRPAPGHRFVVVRAALGTADDVFLRDDRGVLNRATPGFDQMPDCPSFTSVETPERPVYACFVYELDADAKVAGVTYGDLEPNAPLSGRDMDRWPTWVLD